MRSFIKNNICTDGCHELSVFFFGLSMRYICALTIAGSDSSGGAGIQADIKTMSALGVYAASVITSVTVQNTLGVQAIQAIRPEIVTGQIRAVLEDFTPQAIKVGMVNDYDTIKAIAKGLENCNVKFLVVDPVMVSTSGSQLMQKDSIDVFVECLLPKATLLTPNIPEAEILAGMKIQTKADIDEAAMRILRLGCKTVLIKGGHLEGDKKVDLLYVNGVLDSVHTYAHDTVYTRNTHGTGCTLSSAITSFLARGVDLWNSIAQAKEYLSQAIEAGKDVDFGHGNGPVDHLFDPQKLIIV